MLTFRCCQFIVVAVHPCRTGSGGGGSLRTEGARLTFTARVIIGWTGTYVYTGVITWGKQSLIIRTGTYIYTGKITWEKRAHLIRADQKVTNFTNCGIRIQDFSSNDLYQLLLICLFLINKNYKSKKIYTSIFLHKTLGKHTYTTVIF
jgi:hypothetical protein